MTHLPNLFPPYIQPHNHPLPSHASAPLLPSNQARDTSRGPNSHLSLFPKLKHEGKFIVTKHKNTPDAQPAEIARILGSSSKMASFAKISSEATSDTAPHPPMPGPDKRRTRRRSVLD